MKAGSRSHPRKKSMRLVTYRGNIEAAARLGAVVGDLVVDVEKIGAHSGVPLPSSMLDLIDLGPPAWSALKTILNDENRNWPVGAALPLANVKLLAPIPRPRKNIFGIGLNYVEHVAESSRALDTAMELPKQPVIFSKPPTSVIGPDDAIEHNKKITQQLDWEVELAVVMGQTARRVTEADALRFVFGYSVMIDVSARDNRRAGQWIYSKGQDTFAPFGPCIVTADEIADPHALDLWLTVNGVEKQRSNTRHMLFKVPQLIADISAAITLEPGDIIATGTPDGVGAGRNPQEWLWPGDVVEAEVTGIGRLRHPVVAA
jgi:2-keto-4-pentenoate hydratase/2-oxohepta-3-ene-1,7-dioic acid hydratase in catechol pathway